MKTILFLAFTAFFALLSCKNEQPTEFRHKYDLAAILLDSNWVEIIDTLPAYVCLAEEVYKDKGIIINNLDDYNEAWNLTDSVYNSNPIKYSHSRCTYNPPNIDFNNRTLIGFKTITGATANNSPLINERKIFINLFLNKCLQIIHITIHPPILYVYLPYTSWVSIPKLPEYCIMEFDTLWTYNY